MKNGEKGKKEKQATYVFHTTDIIICRTNSCWRDIFSSATQGMIPLLLFKPKMKEKK